VVFYIQKKNQELGFYSAIKVFGGQNLEILAAKVVNPKLLISGHFLLKNSTL
jgi:hypothetical protein